MPRLHVGQFVGRINFMLLQEYWGVFPLRYFCRAAGVLRLSLDHRIRFEKWHIGRINTLWPYPNTALCPCRSMKADQFLEEYCPMFSPVKRVE